MLKNLLTDIKIINNALNTKKLVVFAGAGISIDAGAPSWGELIRSLKCELDLPEYENDFLKIPQIYFNDRQEKEYIEKIRTVLKHKKIRHNEIHEEIFELNPEHILTTNFEDLLEQVISKKSLPYSLVKRDKDLPYSSNTKLLVKIHGDLDDTDFVLKEDDYINYSKNHPLIEAFMNSIFASKVVLFIGYSFSDYNLKQIIQNVRNVLGSNFQNTYLLSVENKIHLSQRQYLKNKGVNVINYNDFINDKLGGNYIETFLKGENIYNQNHFKKGEELSEKGQSLLNFLRFIRFYSEAEIELNKENIIDEIYKSLDRFSELNCLPQSFISELYPFKNSLSNDTKVKDITLCVKNQKLIELFLDNIAIEDNVLSLNVEVKGKSEKERKLKKIITKLNNSLIYKIGVVSNTWSNTVKREKSISLKEGVTCNCPNCKFQDFHYGDVLLDIQDYSITEISDIKKDIQSAYLHYKFGNFLQSFKMFEEISSKAWQTEKYITYYISKKNMKSLNFLIKYNQNNINKEEKEIALNKIEDIDTDKLIFQIPYKSDEEYRLLKTIRDDSILNQYNIQIDKLYKDAEEIFLSYKSQNNEYYGKYYPQSIYIEIYKLITFYTRNYVIADIFSDMRNALQKGFNALLYLHVIDESYSLKLKHLSFEFFRYCCQYYNDSDLYKFLGSTLKVKPSDIKFDDKDTSKIVSYCDNYFQSFFKITQYGENKNQLIFNQLNSLIFSGNTRTIFNNMMIFLMTIDVSKTENKSFVKSLIGFLKYEKLLSITSIKYLSYFIEKNYKIFGRDNLIELINIANSNIKNYSRNNYLDSISFAFEKNNYESITDEDFVFKIILNFDSFDSEKSVIPSFYKISSKGLKVKLKKKLISNLKKNFIPNIYSYCAIEGIIDYNLFLKEYFDFNAKKLSFYTEGETYTYINSTPSLNEVTLSNLIYFMYILKIKSSDKSLQVFSKVPEPFRFFIYRDLYDFSKFNVDWLFLLDEVLIYQEISKIKKLEKIIKSKLKQEFNQKLSDIYSRYFI